MAIEDSDQNLLDEAIACEAARDRALGSRAKTSGAVDDMIARFQGPARSEADAATLTDAPENFEYKYVSHGLSDISFQHPMVSVTTTDMASELHVRALQVGMNRWIKDVKYRNITRITAPDYFFAWFVLIASVEEDVSGPEFTFVNPSDPDQKVRRRGKGMRPVSRRIPFRRAFTDRYASGPYDHRLAGHVVVVDKEDLLKTAREHPEEGWHADIIEGIGVDSSKDLLAREKNADNGPSRREIVYRQIWVRDAVITDEEFEEAGIEEADEHLYHGKLYYICDSVAGTGARGIRKPQPYRGPRWGPYTFGGTYTVPDKAYMVSPLMPVKCKVDWINRLQASANASDEAYGKIIITNNPELARIIKDGRHDFVFGSEEAFEANKSAGTFEKGGSTAPQQTALAIAKASLAEESGLTEQRQGETGAANSASEAVIADTASSKRAAVIKNEFLDAHAQHLTTIAWYLWHEEDVAFRLSPEEGQMLGFDAVAMGEQPVFYGGGAPKDTFDAASITIDPYSTEFTSAATQQRQIGFRIQMYTQLGPLIPMTPWINWASEMRRIAQLANDPSIADMFNLEVAAQMAQSQALADNAAQEAPQAQPTLTGDSKAKNTLMIQPKPTSGQTGAGTHQGAPSKPASSANPGRSFGSSAGKASKVGAA